MSNRIAGRAFVLMLIVVLVFKTCEWGAWIGAGEWRRFGADISWSGFMLAVGAMVAMYRLRSLMATAHSALNEAQRVLRELEGLEWPKH